MHSVINSVCVFKVEGFFSPRLQRMFNMKSGRETQRTFVNVVKWEMVGVTEEDARDSGADSPLWQTLYGRTKTTRR